MESAESDASVVARVNDTLEWLNDRTRFSTFEELQDHGSAFLLATLQLISQTTLHNVNRSPTERQHHVHNANIFLEALRKQFGITFPDVSAELICDGDRTALLHCLDVIDFLKAKAQESASAQEEDAIHSGPSSHACREQHIAPEAQSPNHDDSATAFRSTDVDAETIKKWNVILSWLRLPGVSTLQEVVDNCSSLVTLVVESLLNRRLPNIIRSPLLLDHYIHNANVALRALESFVGRSLDHICATEICEGDPGAIRRCADVLYEIYSIVVPFQNEMPVGSGRQQAIPKSHRSVGASQNRRQRMGRLRVSSTRTSASSGKRKSISTKAASKRANNKSKRKSSSTQKKLSIRGRSTPEVLKKGDCFLEEDDTFGGENRAPASENLLDSGVVAYKDLLHKHVQALARKNHIELEKKQQRLLRTAALESRMDNAWRRKLEIEIEKDMRARQAIRDGREEHAVQKVFRTALKLERDYMREQQRAHKQKQKQLEAKWQDKRDSIDNFFRDKYEMMTTNIRSERARRRTQELDLRCALRRMETELRVERKRGLQELKEKLKQHDERLNYIDLRPEMLLQRLLKMRV